MAEPVAPPAHEPLGEDDVQAIDELREVYARLRKELGRVIVGQHAVIERLAICLFARGHAPADGRARAWPRRCWSASSPRRCR